MECLHGNFRAGQEHLNAGFSKSIWTKYGNFPLPLHSPQRALPSVRNVCHFPIEAKARPLFAVGASGANCNICVCVHIISWFHCYMVSLFMKKRNRPLQISGTKLEKFGDKTSLFCIFFSDDFI
jgi:hypothetical protein